MHFTKEITPELLVKNYEASGVEAKGRSRVSAVVFGGDQHT